MKSKDIQSTIGNTPLVKIPTDSTHGDIFVKLEGNNPGAVSYTHLTLPTKA